MNPTSILVHALCTSWVWCRHWNCSREAGNMQPYAHLHAHVHLHSHVHAHPHCRWHGVLWPGVVLHQVVHVRHPCHPAPSEGFVEML